MRDTFSSSFHRQAIGCWRLYPGHAVGLRARRDALLRIYCGRVWATLGHPAGVTPDSAGDRFLGPGDVLRVPAGARLVMESLPAPGEVQPVHFDWSDAPVSIEQDRFAREVLSPARDVFAALGLASRAMGRVLRGLLGCGEQLLAGRGRWLSPTESLRS